MPVPPAIAALVPEMLLWRRDIHAHPEAAFEERRTAALVAEKLRSWGIEVTEGVGRTGVVGSLTTGEGPCLGLRADMDALKIVEAEGLPHRSTVPGRAHACGHDGHVAMLLGAAKVLAESRKFKGTVRFVFQPAEELEGGADAMVRDGLFERFPMDEIY
ncbi:MAG: amidohydrolase, partial [Magnetospirillum sp. WYHS-4]